MSARSDMTEAVADCLAATLLLQSGLMEVTGVSLPGFRGQFRGSEKPARESHWAFYGAWRTSKN